MQALDAIVRDAEGPILIEPIFQVEHFGSCRRILVPLDGSPTAEMGVFWAQAIARHCGGAIGLIRVAHAEPIERQRGSEALEREWIDAERYLAAQQVVLRDAGFESWRVVAVGVPASVIAGYVRTAQIDLVVMTTCGRSGPQRRAYGRVCEGVLRAIPLGVLLIPPRSIDAACAEGASLWMARRQGDRIQAVKRLLWSDVERALRKGWNPGREGGRGYHRALADPPDCPVVEWASDVADHRGVGRYASEVGGAAGQQADRVAR